ncbi:Eco57I restriction-modification methylase domain-containing protein [Pontimonas sp.]|nr:Eco57I restriction-modification methylase domain-containing protein [Pontimonas sp.]
MTRRTNETVAAPSSRMPDILDVIAALSSDAIPTPPLLARVMLDILPAEVWGDPGLKWLNPASKSGSILREISKRLMIGLEKWEPDLEKRADHILKNMLFGAATTQIHGDMSRRSLYVSRDASGKHSIVQFEDMQGNILFVPSEHDYRLNREGRASGPCKVCSAPLNLERGARRENYAYSFIHGTYPTGEMKDMKFDVIVGNPPYQTGDGRTSESPLYHLFIEAAIALNPKYLAMIVPSRWFSGGKGLDEFRMKMIEDRRIRTIVDNPKLFDCFPGVEIKGGVNYFLWDRDYNGDCQFFTRIDGQIVSESTRDLRAGEGVVIRDNKASSIVEKCSPESSEDSLVGYFSSQFPFGQSITTNYSGASDEPFKSSVPLIFGSHVGYVSRDSIERNHEKVDKWKVLLPKAGDGHGRQTSYVLGEPLALAPGSVCTQTYLIAGTFDSEREAENYAWFLTTKFVRFLVLQRKSTQDIKPDKFRFVPSLEMTRRWLDEELYESFGLTQEEIDYIEESIHPREPNLSLESEIPASHLPGGAKYRAPGDRQDSEGPSNLSLDDEE